jgi:hypothetical protein
MEQILVPFEAADAGCGEPSWGQRDMSGVGGQEGRHITMGGATALPPGTSVEAVVDGIRFLMVRHPSLRTRFRIDSARRLCEQVVYPRGELVMAVIDAQDPGQTAADTAIAFDQSRFDFAEEWPLRLAVIRHGAVPTHAVVIYNHIAVDAGGLDVLLADLAEQSAHPADIRTPPAGLQPLEQALWQASPAGKRQSVRALKHWGRVLREAPASQFPNRRAESGADLAVRAIAARTRQGSGHILLAAYAIAVARVSGTGRVVLRVVVGNRFRPGLEGSVSAVSQAGLWSIDASDATFDAVVARTLAASLDTYKNAYYDPEERHNMISAIERERGRRIVLDCCYNDRRRGARIPESGDPATIGATRAEFRAALDRSRLHWEPWTVPTIPEEETLYLHVDDVPGGLVFTLCGDTAYVAPTEFEMSAHMIEDVLVRAALDPDTALGVPRPRGSR